ncbi:MAG: BolA family protein [Roseiarcus sp.]
MNMKDRIAERLTGGLAPSVLEIVDESDRHAGHAGHRHDGPKAGGETHYRIRIVSERFAGMNRVARHRAVYDLLGAEIADGVHALALQTLTPDEA